MRDSMKITVKYQFVHILLTQLAAVGIVFLFGAFIFYYFTTINIAKQILSIAMIGVEFAMLYVASKKLANRDAKSYTPLKPSRIKGVLFGVQIAVINIVLLCVFIYVWKNFAVERVVEDTVETGLDGIIPICYNAFYVVWSFAYSGLMPEFNGAQVGYIAPALMVIAPVAATTLGYIAGCKNFELAEKLDTFVYEKEESGEDNNDASGNNR